MRADENPGFPREVVDILDIEFMYLDCIILQVKDNGTYSLGFGDTPDYIDLYGFYWV